MKKYKVVITNIIYDLCPWEEREDNYLPHEMYAKIYAENEDELEEEIADHIHDTTGFLVENFDFDIL